MEQFAELSDEALADQITLWSGRIAAAQAHLLALIAEFDRREAWGGHGLLSCAHWLSWRTGLGPTAARERVRVARALRDLPALDRAFSTGEIYWSQVRALTRVAAVDDRIDWVTVARHATAAQLERIVRGIRRVRNAEEALDDPEQAAYRARTRVAYAADGSMTITIRVSAEDGALITAGLAAVKARLDRETAPLGAPVTESADVPAGTTDARVPATDADALLQLARSALDDQQLQRPALGRRERARLVVQADPLSGWGRLRDGELLPPATVTPLLPRGWSRVPEPGMAPYLQERRRHDAGRTRREPSLALRELLGSVDGERCRFPGCTRHRVLHAHHVRHWSRGGRTDLDNLVLLCSRHHTLVHAHGYGLTLAPDRTLRVSTADGTPLPHHPRQPWGDPADLDPAARVTPSTLPPSDISARIDLGYVVHVLLQQAA